jgi:hypothetical protein
MGQLREQGVRSATHREMGNTHRVGNTMGAVRGQSSESFPPLHCGGGLGRGADWDRSIMRGLLSSINIHARRRSGAHRLL